MKNECLHGVYHSNKCGAVSIYLDVDDNPLVIANNSEARLKIDPTSILTDIVPKTPILSPIPAKGILSITGISTHSAYQIYNAKGVQVKKGTIITNQINLKELPNGIYLF